jgi:hypothetical protein
VAIIPSDLLFRLDRQRVNAVDQGIQIAIVDEVRKERSRNLQLLRDGVLLSSATVRPNFLRARQLGFLHGREGTLAFSTCQREIHALVKFRKLPYHPFRDAGGVTHQPFVNGRASAAKEEVMIEERITELELIVQKLHELHGHKWFGGVSVFGGRNGGGLAECACGASEYRVQAEWLKLPNRWDLESEW